ncbi:MAG: endopeptidase [Ramlibacter sp.]|nr:endopeptidase [Ramlibacter sp.]
MNWSRASSLLWLPLILTAGSDGLLRVRDTPAPVAVAALAKPPLPKPEARTIDGLTGRLLVVPVQGVLRGSLQDTFAATRGGGRSHKALDIMAPWGTPVLAADDGRLEKISSNRAGGLSAYQSEPSGRFIYYYAHLAGYADGLKEGQMLHRGDVIGYVGTTGNAPATAPHLHFQVMLLEQKGRWWGGEAVNPYAALAQGNLLLAAGAEGLRK